MNKKAAKKNGRRPISLFYRIVGGITIPLLLLLFIFIFVIVRRELSLQSRYYNQEGRAILQSLDRRIVDDVFSDPALLDSPAKLRKRMDELSKVLKIEKVDLIDYVRQTSITSSRGTVLSDEELLNIQKTLDLKRKGTGYYLTQSRDKRVLLGYLPLQDPVKNRILIATTQSRLLSVKKASAELLSTFGLITLVVFAIALFIAFGLTIRIVRPIRAINRACREILEGNLGLQVSVRTGDELEIMANNFNRMSQSLLVMTRQASDSNPLTRLPGNREITRELSQRIESREKFAYFHADLDHFKAYNDHYGLAKGDDVIRRTGEMITETIHEVNNKRNFVGHQGGDDFVLMLDLIDGPQIADAVCKKFDAALKEFYDQETLERGYFVGEDERAASLTGEVEIKRHPLMSISLAGVSNQKRDFLSYQDVMGRSVPVKKKAKKIPYSKFLIEE